MISARSLVGLRAPLQELAHEKGTKRHPQAGSIPVVFQSGRKRTTMNEADEVSESFEDDRKAFPHLGMDSSFGDGAS